MDIMLLTTLEFPHLNQDESIRDDDKFEEAIAGLDERERLLVEVINVSNKKLWNNCNMNQFI